MPEVSVILPVYNGARYIEESVSSILKQTFRDFELIIIDDGSTDTTVDKVTQFDDPRVRVLRHIENMGAAQATNTGFQTSVGRYIALQDGDDIALPHRLDTQVRLMKGQPKLSILGGQMQCFGASQAGTALAPRDDAAIKAQLLVGSTNIYNPTAMLRREFLYAHELKWDAAAGRAFDWAFYVGAMLLGAKFANALSPMVHYRVHADQQSKDQQSIRSTKAQIRQRVVAAFFPNLTVVECSALEPLLDWASPPLLRQSEVLEGLAALAKALAPMSTQMGECRDSLHRYLTACQQRWAKAAPPRPA